MPAQAITATPGNLYYLYVNGIMHRYSNGQPAVYRCTGPGVSGFIDFEDVETGRRMSVWHTVEVNLYAQEVTEK